MVAHDLHKEDGVQPEKIAMLKRTADLLFSFLALYPKDPLADDAGFSLANCLLALKNYPPVGSLSADFARKVAASPPLELRAKYRSRINVSPFQP